MTDYILADRRDYEMIKLQLDSERFPDPKGKKEFAYSKNVYNHVQSRK